MSELDRNTSNENIYLKLFWSKRLITDNYKAKQLKLTLTSVWYILQHLCKL